MIEYIFRRLLITIPTLLAIVTLVFLIIHMSPGDPAVVILGDYASKEAVDALREKMGLNDPLYVQYFRFLSNLIHGDLGRSCITGMPVANRIASALPFTLELTLTAIVMGAFLGVPLGILSAVQRNSFFDYLIRTLSLGGISMPSFYLGILLMLVFGVTLALLPVVGAGDIHDLRDNVSHLILPALALGLRQAAYITRMARSSMLNVIGEEYITTAKAKGLSDTKVILIHALRNALIPIISIIGLYSVVLIGSGVMIEIVFSRPGLGKMLLGAMHQRDYTALQSLMLLYGLFVLIINLAVDFAYSIIDPRVKYN